MKRLKSNRRQTIVLQAEEQKSLRLTSVGKLNKLILVVIYENTDTNGEVLYIQIQPTNICGAEALVLNAPLPTLDLMSG